MAKLTVHDDGEDAPDGGGDLVVVGEAGQALVVVAPDTIDNIHELEWFVFIKRPNPELIVMTLVMSVLQKITPLIVISLICQR